MRKFLIRQTREETRDKLKTTSSREYNLLPPESTEHHRRNANMQYTIFKRSWPMAKKRWIWLIFLAELIILIPCLVIFGIAQPDGWRTKMWEIGYEHGFNSDPRMIVYAAANYRPKPDIPFVWSQTLTDFNVALTVVTLFALLIKMVLYIMKCYYPLLALLNQLAMVALWTTSMYGQMGPDHAHPDQQSNVAWYIAKSCDYAGGRFRAVKECRFSKASFAITVLMVALMLLQFGLAVWAMWPNQADRGKSGKSISLEDEEDEDSSSVGSGRGVGGKQPERVVMTNMTGAMGPASPGMPPRSPFTPRTQAFNQLDRKLPLRAQYG